MKKPIYLWAALVLSLFSSVEPAHGYKFVIYTDEVATNKSEQVVELFKKTYPFNTFDIKFEIVKMSPEELDCKRDTQVEGVKIGRLVTCNDIDKIQKKADARGGDQAMIIKTLPMHGGSSGVGGGVPVMTADSSPRVMLHEYLHTLGLCDEYKYEEKEANIYCAKLESKPNAAVIAPEPPYSDDSVARAKHQGAIPWYRDIAETTLITNDSNLGTGTVDKKPFPPNNTNEPWELGEPTGLYRGKTCDNLGGPRQARVIWHPGGSSTVMDNIEAGLGGPTEKIVERLMLKKGARKKMSAVIQEVVNPDVERVVSSVGEVATAEPPKNVNNTGRGFFKSFFGWVKSVFESIGRAFSR